MQPDYGSLAELVGRWCAGAGVCADRLRLDDHGKPVIVLKLFAELPGLPPVTNGETASQAGRANSFSPNETQNAILDARAGKARRTDALAHACDIDRRTLFKVGGIKELQAAGWVAWHRRVGYFRPDYPPADIPPEVLDEASSHGAASTSS